METEARRGESSKQGAWDSEPDSDCSSAPWIPPFLCTVHPAGPEAGGQGGRPGAQEHFGEVSLTHSQTRKPANGKLLV